MAITLSDAATMALSFVFFVVVIGIGATVLTGIQGTQQNTACANYTTNSSCWSVAENVTRQGLIGTKNLSDQSGVLGTIIGAAVIIGVLVGAFYFAQRQ